MTDSIALVKENLFLLLRLGLGFSSYEKEIPKYNPTVIEEVYALAKKHDLAHIVAFAIKKHSLACDEEIRAKLEKQYFTAVYRYQHQNHDLEVISDLFEEAEIMHIPLKGSVLRKFYPYEWMRIGCDIDILIKPEDVERAMNLMQDKLGYKYIKHGGHDETLSSPAGTHIELHFDLIEEDEDGVDVVLQDFWKYTSPDENKKFRYTVRDDMLYYYHIAHMAKHFINGGCGLRPVLDSYILINTFPYDREARIALLERGGLARFSSIAEKLAGVWFSKEEHNEISKKTEDYILDAGVYGDMHNAIVNKMAEKDGSKMKYLLSRIFLPYLQLRVQYPYLDGRKWLLPVYQVRRWFRLLFRGKLRRSINEINTSLSVKENENDERGAFLRSVGLL